MDDLPGGHAEDDEGQLRQKPQVAVQTPWPHSRLLSLSAVLLGRATLWSGVTMQLMPRQVITMAGERYKGTALGFINAALVTLRDGRASHGVTDPTTYGLPVQTVAAIGAGGVPPVVGAVSDRTWLDAELQRRRWWWRWLPAGRRRPWTAVAAVLVAVALLFMGLAGNPGVGWVVVYGLATTFMASADAFFTPALALLPDLVPAAQYGAASAYAGLAQMAYIPRIPEGRVAVVGMFGCYVILAALVLVFSAITVFSVSEATAHPQKAAHVPALIDAADDDDVDPFEMREEVVYDVQPVWRRGRGWLKGACAEGWANLHASLRDRNFACVWINRFLFNCGFQVMMSPYNLFGLFELDQPEQATSLFVIVSTVGSLLSSVVSGILSDRSGLGLTGVAVAMTGTTDFSVMMGLALVFGISYGTYISVAFALVSDTLPSSAHHARDIGLWTLSENLPAAALALSAVLLLLAVVVAAFIDFPSPAVDQPPEESDQRQVEVDPLTTESSSDASNAA
ncbi:transporter, major facilitator subfamily protein [Acanthamoeba castellanii str. Neff]|uniref:Transporter, major facilitator subfamily protein n=1 Tax=Acanthamoeba castellanii (strain ATCC 30010 / Neff) TaxID=1257118 RepID=L8GNJ0_ACACF|nr:transporter, major facilitator subfamily protein [Acanthamoeba castellanii str. Neff]ELR14318.1 transporter, major facilitator subfamily protein [Acanthamoeba castellanii str. Neff]